MKLLFKILLSFLLFSTYFFLLTSISHASDIRNDYQVEYFLSEIDNKLQTKVKFTVSVTIFNSEVFVKQFSIGFPKLFTIKDIKAFDDKNEVIPEIKTVNSITQLSAQFTDPNIGKNSVNNLYFEFLQDNLFKINGNIWEVIIPTIEDNEEGSYKIIVHLPENTDKKISIAKPNPDSISGNTIVWNNPTTKTVYAVFGDIQYYQTELTYHLDNSGLIPVYTDIAFPPDTLWQKTYLENINPLPAKIFSDQDGNLLGRYYLNPREKKNILYKGTVASSVKPREEMISSVQKSFQLQKKYLLSSNKLWQLPDNQLPDVSAEVKNIYSFVVNNLSYNYNKINTENKRLGAASVLTDPKNAVCTEFTDLFIALARKKGIYSREIQGYGFSQDPQLRPLSLVSDILHSWPEYYNSITGLWVPVDPTWQNTSGIDYFSSFDLNHITFAVHGKDPEYPFPAGTYKTENSRDITVNASANPPTERQNISYSKINFPKNINDSSTYQVKIRVQNLGNVYYWGPPLGIKSKNLILTPDKLSLAPLAPHEKKEFVLAFRSKEKNKKLNSEINITFPGNKKLSADIIILPYYYQLSVKISVLLLIVCILILSLRQLKKIKQNAN